MAVNTVRGGGASSVIVSVFVHRTGPFKLRSSRTTLDLKATKPRSLHRTTIRRCGPRNQLLLTYRVSLGSCCCLLLSAGVGLYGCSASGSAGLGELHMDWPELARHGGRLDWKNDYTPRHTAAEQGWWQRTPHTRESFFRRGEGSTQ